MAPAYICGGSNGQILSLLFGYSYPEDTVALILISPPTDDPEVWAEMAGGRYFALADVAEQQGMDAVIEVSENSDGRERWIADGIAKNPRNRDLLFEMEIRRFVSVMRKWGEAFEPIKGRYSGLSDDELRSVKVPRIVFPGFNETHPQHTAEDLRKHLPGSELVDYSIYFSGSKIKQMKEWESAPRLAELAPSVEEFVKRTEAER
jgi:pimeloyl-ACP methyl ester carboxylesterase